jgi:hypothetical protein
MPSIFAPADLTPSAESLISFIVKDLRSRQSLIRVDRKTIRGSSIFKIRNASNRRAIYIVEEQDKGIRVNLTQTNPAHADFIAQRRRVDVKMQYVNADSVDVAKLRDYITEDVGEIYCDLLIPTVARREDIKTEDQVFASFARQKPNAPMIFKEGKEFTAIILFPSMEEVLVDLDFLGRRSNYLRDGVMYVENINGVSNIYRVAQFRKMFKTDGIEIPNLQ